MKNLFVRFGILISLVLVLSGCARGSKEVSLEQKSVDESSNSKQFKIGVPFSEGPNEPPNVRGPNSPTPVVEAVTEVENIKLTLPVKTQ